VLILPYRFADKSEILALQENSDVDLSAAVPENFYSDLDNIPTAYAGGVFLVAELNDRIVGMGGLLSTGEIVRMRVHTEHRRQGIATDILAKLVDWAREIGMRRVFLHTQEEQVAAQQLYITQGFEEVGRGTIHGNSVVGYERLLDS
jgi:GNAT superfamily N-acetyltransferase